MQKVIIIGHLARDPETRMSTKGSSICSFTVPVNDKRGQEEKTEWFKVKAFGKTAEFCANYLGKGRLVYVEGKLETQKYTDKNGQERTVTEILAETVQSLDRPNAKPQQAAYAASAPSERSFQQMEDIPF